MDQTTAIAARPRIINPYWLLAFGVVCIVLQLGGFILHQAPITPLDLWYQPVQVLWANILIIGGGFALCFWSARRAARRAAADPAWLAQEQQRARDLLRPRPGLVGALMFLLPFLVFAVFIGGSFAALVLTSWDASTDAEFKQKLALLFMAMPVGILAIGIGAYWVRTHNRNYTPPPPFTRQQIKTRLGVMLGIALAMLYAIAQQTYQFTYERPTAGPAASWTAQRNFAQMLAARVDPAAALDYISVYPVAYRTLPAPADTVFDLTFTFTRPDGGRIRMEIADTEPPRLLRTSIEGSGTDSGYARPADELNRGRAVMAMIERTPREVYQATLPLAQAIQTGTDQPRPSLYLYATHDQQARYGVLAVWEVYYPTSPASLTLLVHPQTGAVLDREQR